MAIASDLTTKLNRYLETAEHRSYFVIFVTVVFVIIMTVFGILPAYSAFTLQGTENQKRQEAIVKLESKLKTLKSLTEESQNKSNLINYFEFIFPAQVDQDFILNEIIEAANQSSVYLKDLTFNENQDFRREFESRNIQLDSKVKSQNISMNLEGSHQTLNNFIKDLESKRRIYNIKSFNITRKSEQAIAVTTPDKYYNLVMNVSIYYFENTNI